MYQLRYILDYDFESYSIRIPALLETSIIFDRIPRKKESELVRNTVAILKLDD